MYVNTQTKNLIVDKYIFENYKDIVNVFVATNNSIFYFSIISSFDYWMNLYCGRLVLVRYM